MATVNLFFDNRATAQNEGIIKIVVTHNRKQRLYTTGIKITPDQWKDLPKKGEKLAGTVKDETRRKLYADIYAKPNGYYRRAETIAEAMGETARAAPFDFESFKDQYDNWGVEKKEVADTNSVFAAMVTKAATMRKADRIGNALNYEQAAKSLSRYVASLDNATRKDLGLPPLPKITKRNEDLAVPVLQFEHLTSELLTDYENWATKYGKSPQTSNPKKGNAKATGASLTTVGIYLRHLRAVVNDAIEAGIMPRDAYPFGRNRYTIPAGTNTKKALSKEDIQKLMQYECLPHSLEQRSRDLWVFSYLTNGMNLADVCRLRWQDLDRQADRLTFVRQKTARSKKGNQTKIVAKVFAESWAIIERWGNTDQRPTAYLFPFLESGTTAEREKVVVHQIIKMTNRWVKRIAEAVGIEGDVTTYAARHSFATILLQSEAPLAFISKSLGHTNLKTTENYLGSFSDEKIKSYLDNLL
ncbi:MAG: hypothetical protein EAZ14_03885 [Runella slithyformis]|nr:MAG: hypothetical protein EAZ14_03885 [Runella slithyformis]